MRLPPALGEFPKAWGKVLCTVQPATPVPSPPLQASLLFRVSTCPWFPSQLMQIPQHSFTFSSLRQGFTDSLSLHDRIVNIFFPSDLLVLLCLKPSSLPSKPVLSVWKFAGTDFAQLVWYLAWECPTDSPQAALFITQADAVTHTWKRLATISLRFVGRGVQHSHACATSSWTENSFTPRPCRADVFQQGLGGSCDVGKASDLGQDRERWVGREKRIPHPSWWPQDQPLPARLSSENSAYATPRPLAYILIGT